MQDKGLCEGVINEELRKPLAEPKVDSMAGSVSGREINETLQQFLKDNENISLPYGGTEGYWNAFVHRFNQMGFEIVKKQNVAG